MTNRIIQVGISFACILLVLSISSLSAQAQTAELLRNPGLEAPYIEKGGELPRSVANGWEAWNVEANADQPDFESEPPEYFQATRTDRIRSGEAAQRYESFFATHTGGIFQVVPAVGAGNEVSFGIYAYVWSSSLDDESTSEGDGDVNLQVGIDPTGGVDGTSSSIIWSEDREEYDAYNEYVVSAVAEADTVSVWVRSQIELPVQNTQIYLDDAFLSVEGQEQAQASPTVAPPTATNTLPPSPTPQTPTATSTPTEVPTEVETDEAVAEEDAQANTGSAPNEVFTDTIEYEVEAGDSLFEIAQRFDSTITAIAEANDLDDITALAIGQTLVVPVRVSANLLTATLLPIFSAPEATPTPAADLTNTQTYVVQPGDSLSRIAREFETTAQEIAQINGIVNPNSIFRGQQLIIPLAEPATADASAVPEASATPSAQSEMLYTIQPGDTLYRISLEFDVPLAELIEANNIENAGRIAVGEQIVIP